jgi:hypothetical protein
MKTFHNISLLLLIYSIQLAYSLSRPIAIQPDPTYQTGVQILFNSNFNSLTTVAFGVPFNTAMPTSSLNASLGIMGTKYYMISNVFGWKMSVGSVSINSLSIDIKVISTASYLFYMKISYLVSCNT